MVEAIGNFLEPVETHSRSEDLVVREGTRSQILQARLRFLFCDGINVFRGHEAHLFVAIAQQTQKLSTRRWPARPQFVRNFRKNLVLPILSVDVVGYISFVL